MFSLSPFCLIYSSTLSFIVSTPGLRTALIQALSVAPCFGVTPLIGSRLGLPQLLKAMPTVPWASMSMCTCHQITRSHLIYLFLFFLRINESGQSNMDATTAAQKFRQYITPLKQKGYTTLVAPVTSSEPKGFDIMIDFMSQCSDCQVNLLMIRESIEMILISYGFLSD